MNRKKLIALLVSFSLLIGCATIPYPAKATTDGTTFRLSTQYGGITITGSQICYYAGPTDQGGYTVETLGSDDTIVIYGSGKYGITVTGGQRSTFDIVLQNVNINTSSKKDESALALGPNATVNLKLEGTNTLQSGENSAGIQVPETAVLNFESDNDNSGTLNAVGGEWAAGIGGGFKKAANGYSNLQAVGQINLNYYRINAVGGDFGAGIGGGWGRDGGQITLNGGTVTATGGWGGAGIGGGDGGNGGTININDGIITAQRTYYRQSDKKYYAANSASIGGGNDGKGGNININGGTVTTQPIERNSEAGKLYDSGTGIGGGWDGDAGIITIRGGAITVYANSSATGIGGGYGDTTAGNGGTITISGGRVTINSMAGTAIGGGRSVFKEAGAGGNIQISGGYVSARSEQGVAIGGGYSTNQMSGAGANVTITGGTVIAFGCNLADIGSGRNIYGNASLINPNEGSCTIDGGAVFADKLGPVPHNTAGAQVYLTTVTIPGISSPTEVSYTIDQTKQYSSDTDDKGRLFLWLPSTDKADKAVVISLSTPGKAYTASGIVTAGENAFVAARIISAPSIQLSSANATGGGLTYSITPGNGESTNIKCYVIQLYLADGTVPIGNPMTTELAYGSIPLASGITEGTSYTAKVKAVATTESGQLDSLYGALCPVAVAAGSAIPLHAPDISLLPSNKPQGGLDYSIKPVPNETTHVNVYSIQLYNGTEVLPIVVRAPSLTGTIPFSSIEVEAPYQARVQAIGRAGSGYSDSDKSALSNPAVPSRAWQPLSAPSITLTSSSASGGLSYTIIPVQAEAQMVKNYFIQLYRASDDLPSGILSVSTSSLTGSIPLSGVIKANTDYRAQVMAVANLQGRMDSMYSTFSPSAQAASAPSPISRKDYSPNVNFETALQPDGNKVVTVGVPATNKGSLVTGSVTDVKGLLPTGGQLSGSGLDFQFNVPPASGTTGASLSFTGASFSQLAGTGGTMTFHSEFGSVDLSSGALSSIANAANGESVSLTLSKAPPVNTGSGPRPTYDIGVQAGGGAITSFGGATINFTVPYTPQAGEDVSALVMYYHGSHGDVPVHGYFRNHAMSASTAHLSEYYIGYHKVTFQDVPSESWYSNAVTFIAAREITKGTGSGLFSPNKTLTRGEFMTMLLRAYCIEPDTSLNGNFSDAGHDYYTGYLAAAKRLGIALGNEEHKFEPEKELTRQDMFTLLNRTLTVLHEPPAGESKNVMSNFSDGSSVSDYAHEAVKTMVEHGVISGANGKINPTGLTNRAEMAQTLYKLLS